MEQKRGYFLSIIIIIFMILMWKPTIVSAGGDSMGGRPEYTIDQINNGDLGDTIIFNSISDGVFGHEYDFVDVRIDDGREPDNYEWYGSSITVEDGKYYIIRMYIHNNNPNGRDAIAKDVHAMLNIPEDTGGKIQVNGFIKSSNAVPDEYWDGVTFNSDQPFHLEYIDGSARLANNGAASVDNGDDRGVAISDDLVYNPNGIKIGYNAIDDGEIPGGLEFDEVISVRLKAVYDLEYTIQTSVRPAGTKGNNWTNQLEVNVGDEVEYQIVYKNTSDEDQHDVMLRDLIPDNIEPIAGTTKLWNDFFEGATSDTEDLFNETGLNLGDYGPGANAIIRFNAKVVDENLVEGTNTLVNWGQGTVDNALLQSSASIIVQKIEKFKIVSIISIATLIVCIMNNIQLRRKMRQYE